MTTIFVFLIFSFPDESNGSLVIVGGGSVPAEAKTKFIELAGGKQKAKIIVIPTASISADKPREHESSLKQWKELGPASVELLHTRDRKQADDPAFAKPIREATAVWFSGGDQNRLIEAYKGTLVEKELHKLLERGGVIGGTSAGAAVMSGLMIQGGREADVKSGPGFDFLNGWVVDQHFTQRKRIGRLRKVLSANPNLAGMGIDEGTAAVVRGKSLTVVGAGTVTLIESKNSLPTPSLRVLKTGESFDLSGKKRELPAKKAG